MGNSSSTPQQPAQVNRLSETPRRKLPDSWNSSPINRVSIPPPKKLSDTPWRKLPNSGDDLFKSLLKEIKSLKPERKPLILLVGPVGAGKSSFINSCLSVVMGRKINFAKSGSAVSSYTLEFKNYMLLDTFRLMDCMGIEPGDEQGFHPGDIVYMLQGHVMKNYKFDEKHPMTPNSPFYRKEPNFEHKAHCVVFVVDSNTIHAGIPRDYVDKINILQAKIQDADVHRVLLLTKVDKLCDEVSKDASCIFRSLIIKDTVKLASEVFSINIASVHPVINFEEVVELSTKLNIPVALALRDILRKSSDGVKHYLDDLKDSEDEIRRLTDSPWRGSMEFGNDWLERKVNDINTLCPEKKPIILLVGPAGAGKSSFINSCMTVGAQRKKGLAQTGSASSGYTKECKIYKDNAFLKNFRLMDIMGIQPRHGKGLFLDDIPLLLQGHVKKNYKFDPGKAITKDSKYYRKEPKIEHKVHCVVLVIDSRFMDNDNLNMYDKIKHIQMKINEADVPRVLILTHVDKLCKAVSEDVSNMFRSPTVERAVEKASEVFSIEMASIHPVINYEDTSEFTTEMSVPIVLALHQIFLYTSDRIEQVMNDSDDSDDDDDHYDDESD